VDPRGSAITPADIRERTVGIVVAKQGADMTLFEFLATLEPHHVIAPAPAHGSHRQL
jgi:hypothetical protein